jgi:predicted dehydrogenase
MAKQALNIGLVGCGFMGRTHSNAFRQVPQFFDTSHDLVLKAVCARTRPLAEAFASNWGYETVETDWRALVARPDIDLIDIAAPNNTHAEIAIAAARAGKMVACEKPLGASLADSEAMVRAVEDAGVANMVWYNYRRVPAVTFAKQMVDAGLWRLDAAVAGSGVTGDRHRHVAQWRHHRGFGDDRDLHPGAPSPRHRQDPAGIHRRRRGLSGALRQWLARDLRGNPLRTRPQGALYAGDQRRTRLDRLGSA